MNTPNLLETIDNFVFDEISIGQTARPVRTLTLDAISVDDFDTEELRSAGYASLVAGERGKPRAVA